VNDLFLKPEQYKELDELMTYILDEMWGTDDKKMVREGIIAYANRWHELQVNAAEQSESKCNKHSVKHRCLHCGKPIVFDNYAASWIHKREWKGNDNGYYCDNNKPDINFTATPNNGV
jgi:hypothetical protein